MTRSWQSQIVTGDTHFYSARCIFNKVVSDCPHFYYLPTSWAPFAHLGDAPLCQMMSASSKLHAQMTLRCPEMSAITVWIWFSFYGYNCNRIIGMQYLSLSRDWICLKFVNFRLLFYIKKWATLFNFIDLMINLIPGIFQLGSVGIKM